MSRINWQKKLGWTEEHLDEIRNAGYSYIRQGKYSIALPFFEALVILDPDSAYDAQALGALYVETNQPVKAIKYLDRALQLEADHSPTLLNLTKAFFMSGRREDGIRLAQILQNDTNPFIAGTASALLMTYS
ncbi:MAG: type III secretion chaperone [Verrucomicrobia bacterium]|nr:type III secretion chaperone [Verrucomicrobiota bacterium]MBS0636609.1 type III secretion chaperone [Verrucomicrobiota bacterium]